MRNIIRLFLIIVIICIIYGFNNTEKYSVNQDIERIQTTTTRLCLKYYSIEGKYPSSIDELVNDYGLRYDNAQYIINYHKEADNILPQIKVYRKEKNYE
jgi:hypothetical protein